MTKLDDLLEQLAVEDYEECLEIVEQLVEMGDGIVDDLIMNFHQIAGNQQDDYRRAYIVLALGRFNTKKTFDIFVEASESQVYFTRESGIYALGQLGDARAVGILVAVMRHHYDRDAREEATWALEHYPERWVIRAIIRAYSDPDHVVQDAVVWSLMQMGKPAMDILQETLKDDNSLMRENSQQILKEITSKK